ncbi:MAG: hypothetical protein QOC98_2929 [Frankiaceae bacterium]|nr:hypothetical protein [Frankiaceae bacterium]
MLAEEALGGPAALRATPFQTVAGGAYRVAILPGRYALTQFNRAADRVSQSTDVVRSRVLGLKGKAEGLGDKATQFTETAADVARAGVNAGLRTSEGKARANSQTAGENIHEARRKVGALDADELPIKNYGELSAGAAAEAVKNLTKAEDIRTVVRHEEAHKNRSSVVSAAQTTLARLAKEAVNS